MAYQNKASCAFLQHRMFSHECVIAHRQMLQVSFRKRATNERVLLRKMTDKDVVATLYVPA